MAVRKAVSAATTTFTAISIKRFEIDTDNPVVTVNVVFEPIDYSIHVNVDGIGTVMINYNDVTGGDDIYVTPGTDIPMTITPHEGYSFLSVTGIFHDPDDNEHNLNIRSAGNGNDYEFTYPGAREIKWDNPVVTVNVVFSPIDYDITYNLNGGTNNNLNPSTYNIKSGNIELLEPTKTGYTFDGWYDNENFGGERIYNFVADDTNDLHYLQNREFWAKWTANTYTVHFDANGGSGEMGDMNLTYDGDWINLIAFGFTAPAGKAFKNWNTAQDGSGESYNDKESVRNLTDAHNGTVTLYAQWAEDFTLCDVTVPNQTLEGPNDFFPNISYKFEYANNNYNESYAQEFITGMGVVIKDGDNTLSLGTDYKFGDVTLANDNPIGEYSQIGDECKVEIVGMGNYAGSQWASFKIVAPDANGTWGDNLTWAFDGDSKTLTITGSGEMQPAANNSDYSWFSVARYIETISIGEDITSIAASAFAGTDNVHSYGDMTKLKLPSTLATIGENAFAYCSNLSINLADLDGISYPASAFSYIGSITGTLYDKADNSKTITMMWQAGTNDVTLSGRTLYKDGYWNTICLPFDVKADNDLLTGAIVKELDINSYYNEDKRTGFDDESGALYLFFKDATADGNNILLKAGTPYLIRWTSGDNITSYLTFEDVEVISSPTNITSKDDNVSFIGTFSPAALPVDDNSNLYLGIGKNAQNEDVNALFWPSGSNYINFPNLAGADDEHYYLGAFRAYFHVNLGSDAPELKIVLNFGDESTQTSIGHTEITDITEKAGAWYSLDGRKLQDKPTAKGLYIHGGKKVIIK